MSTVTVEDIRSFAERVERLCDFFLSAVKKDGSKDIIAIQKLKEDAADLQLITRNSNISIEGLNDYMKGL